VQANARHAPTAHINLGNDLKNRSTQLVFVSLTALSLISAVTACAPAQQEKPTQLTAEKANIATSSFLDQVRIDTADYASKFSAASTPQAQQALWDQEYSKSMSYVDAAAPKEQVKKLMDELSMIYLTEPTATIKTDATDFSLVSETAEIKGSDFRVVVDGKRKAETPSDQVMLKLTDAGWKIAGFAK